MRWNSTKTYTEDDMLRMQQEAVNRVHEFQTRARQTLPFYDVPESAIMPYTGADSAPAFPPQTSLPFSAQGMSGEQAGSFGGGEQPMPDAQNQPSNWDGGQNALIQPPQTPPQSQSATSVLPDPIKGLLGKLDLDSEVLLIIGLMFLLYNEKADSLLLLALGYLIL